jgi:hypothetical protein
MSQRCAERGVDFVVVFGYERHQLRSDQTSPKADIARTLEADGIATVDLYDDLRAAELGADSSLYYRENIHWNVRGHRFIADRLRPLIEQRLRDRQRGLPASSAADHSSSGAATIGGSAR